MNVLTLAQEIIDGKRLTREDDLSFFLTCDLDDLCKGADQIREARIGNKVDLCSIINGRSGRCPEDCKYCAQSAHHHTNCEVYDFLPEEFLEKLDFYMFQSGHNREGQDMAYVLPENFRKKYPKKPLINAEPCYEQMGFSRKIYGRFQAEDVRKAAWSSILSGACAGVTYGAHGIWNWQKLNKPANPILGEGFDAPFPWNEALQFPGAWDYGMIRQLLDELHTGELIPAQEVLENETTQIRMAQTTDGRYLLYLPHSTKVVLKRELNGCSIRAVDLASGHRAYVSAVCREGKTEIAMHPCQMM